MGGNRIVGEKRNSEEQRIVGKNRAVWETKEILGKNGVFCKASGNCGWDRKFWETHGIMRGSRELWETWRIVGDGIIVEKKQKRGRQGEFGETKE